LKEIRESRAFEQLGLTWQEFCQQYVGCSRERADAIIRQFDEFGEAYFRLSQIARISPETYRQIEPTFQKDSVSIDGQEFELILPNAAKIRAAIKKMRDERDQARRAADLREPIDLSGLRDRQRAIIEEAHQLSFFYRPDTGRPELVKLANHAIEQWKNAARQFAAKDF
jgi:hypothetical protein